MRLAVVAAAASGFGSLAVAHCVVVALGCSLAVAAGLVVALGAAVAAVALAIAVRILRLISRQAIQLKETSRYYPETGESSTYLLKPRQCSPQLTHRGRIESELAL